MTRVMTQYRYFGLFLIILFLSLSGELTAQISPGELSTAHKHLEGISNCKKCHELGKKVNSQKCLDCHKEIKTLQANKRGYHASREVGQKECFSCHNEHHGRNFEINRIDTLSFDHQITGYTLEGKHKVVACRSCHAEKNIQNKVSQKKGFSYLGLNDKCLSCHTDYHQSTLDTDCLNCHSLENFKPAVKFNHQNTKYPLVGKHAQLDCIKCHKKSLRNGLEFQKFKGIAYRNCTSCHEDIHKNKFGSNCKKCHTQDSFHKVKALSSFNHAQTNFPLEGKHLIVECKTCHKQSYTKRIAHKKCANCHTDYHNKQFTSTNLKSDCSDCHTVNGYRPSLYSINEHNLSDFPLTGAHQATPCFVCHKKTDQWNFKNLGTRCIDCHENKHGKEISAKYFPDQNCLACHQVEIWKQVKFDHALTDFKLEGKHKESSCRDCHFKKDDQGSEKQLFASQSGHCLECHKDQHNGQFETKSLPSCLNCHTYTHWKPDLFNHDETRFKLDGKHKDVDCNKCHSMVTQNSTPFILYKTNKTKCTDCHS